MDLGDAAQIGRGEQFCEPMPPRSGAWLAGDRVVAGSELPCLLLNSLVLEDKLREDALEAGATEQELRHAQANHPQH